MEVADTEADVAAERQGQGGDGEGVLPGDDRRPHDVPVGEEVAHQVEAVQEPLLQQVPADEAQLHHQRVVVDEADVDEVPQVDQVHRVEGGERLLQPVAVAEPAQPLVVPAGVELMAPGQDPPVGRRPEDVEVVGRAEVDGAVLDAQPGLEGGGDVAEAFLGAGADDVPAVLRGEVALLVAREVAGARVRDGRRQRRRSAGADAEPALALDRDVEDVAGRLQRAALHEVVDRSQRDAEADLLGVRAALRVDGMSR